MTEPLVYLDGRLLPQAQAHLALYDAGFVFGATATDLCRTFRHRLYRWPEHLARFRQTCRSIDIDVKSGDDELTGVAERLVAHNVGLIGGNDDLALVLFATPGPIGYYLGQTTSAGEQPTLGMHTFPLPLARYRPWIERGVHLATPSVQAVPPACVDPRIKQRSRLHWWLAEREVRRAHPGAQALLLDADGCVTETASANFLLLKNGTLVSPPLERILGGISLGVVNELCARFGVPREHRPISLDECYAADEALLTCTSYCIAGVRGINDIAIPWPGPMLRQLTQAWSADVGIDIHGQIMNS